MTVHSVYDVFTPTKSAEITFVDREDINDKLVNALRMPGKQLVVYGHSGSGKTTLVRNKLHQLYEKHITSRCMINSSFDQLILEAFDQLSIFYNKERTSKEGVEVSVEAGQDYLAIKNKINAKSSRSSEEKQERMLPPQLTVQALARFMGEAKCCWVLEDFHKAPEEEKVKLSQAMKIFKDMADDYRDVKIIAIGAVGSAREIVKYDKEMKTRVAEILVPLMKKEELKQIIKKGELSLSVKFSKKLTDAISEYSNGLASVCHQLCLNLCLSKGIETTLPAEIMIDSKSLPDALKAYMDEASDSIKKVFDSAFNPKYKKKFDNAKLIVSALISTDQEGLSRQDILKKIREKEPDYPQGNVTTFLRRLSDEEDESLLRFDSTSGKYAFRDPLYRVFARANFSHEDDDLKESIIHDQVDLITKAIMKVTQNSPDRTSFFLKFGELG